MAGCVQKFDKVVIAKSLQALQLKTMSNPRRLFFGMSGPERAANIGGLFAQNVLEKQGWLNTLLNYTKAFLKNDLVPLGGQSGLSASETLVRKYGFAVSSLQQCPAIVGSYFCHNELVGAHNYNHIPITAAALMGHGYRDAEPLLDVMPQIYFCGKHVEPFEDNATPTTNSHNPMTFGGTELPHEPLAGNDPPIESTLNDMKVNDADPELLQQQEQLPEEQPPTVAATNEVPNLSVDMPESKPVDGAAAAKPIEDLKTADAQNNADAGGIVLSGIVDWLKNIISNIRMYFQKF